MKVAVFKADAIGDFVLALGAIRLLADEFGEENLLLAVASGPDEIARLEFPSATIVTLTIQFNQSFQANLPTLIQILRTRGIKCEIAIGLRHSRSLLYQLHTYSLPGDTLFLTDNSIGQLTKRNATCERLLRRLRRVVSIPYPSGDPPCSELTAHAAVLSAALGQAIHRDAIRPRFRTITPSCGHNLIVCPTSRSPDKDYSTEGWIEILGELANEGLPIALCGSPSQRIVLENLARDLRARGVVCSVVLPGNLTAFIKMIADAAFVVTVDTAAAHIATALDKPACVLFSGQAGTMYGPWVTSSRQHWIKSSRLAPQPSKAPMSINDLPPHKVLTAILSPLRQAQALTRSHELSSQPSKIQPL